MKSLNRIVSGRMLALALVPAAIIAAAACTGVPTAFIIQGEPTPANERPTLTITEPSANLTVSRGERFVIRWTDTDGDSNAQISFSLVNAASNQRTLVVSGIAENDLDGLDFFSVSTALIAEGDYFILGTIDDGVNQSVESFATIAGAGSARVVVKITAPGQGPSTVPPSVQVVEPAFNLSVAQDDEIIITVQPPTVGQPFDPDSQVRMWLVLDLDDNPNNDDPANPRVGPDGAPLDVILLETVDLTPDDTAPRSIAARVDLAAIPPRPEGEPYWIRATLDDQNNPRVHRYAPGTINVVQLASGVVDLNEVGKTLSGARFYGFNPSANVGSNMANISDFDQDGVADFVLVAQFGNPRNFGLVGEAYLIYGLNNRRFGGAIPVNSVSDVIDGVILEGPPIRREPSVHRTVKALTGTPGSLGITSVSWIEDLGGDGRPEVLVGLPFVYGAVDTTDFDPDDEDTGSQENIDTIEMTVRRGLVEINEDDDPAIEITNRDYQGVIDTTLSNVDPDTPAGDTDIAWVRDPTGPTKWGLIKFVDLLEEVPDDQFAIDLSSVRSFLEVTVADPGVQAVVWRSLTDFDEQTTYNSYSPGISGDPVEGVDYDDGGAIGFGNGLGTLDTELLGQVSSVDITDLVRQLMLDVLPPESRNEIRLIMVPSDNQGANETRVRSSELTFGPTSSRPTLRVTYRRSASIGAVGCYPDDIVNNRTDTAANALDDAQFYAGGMAALIDSAMRDNDPKVFIDGVLEPRLHNTSIALELVGQRANFTLDRDDIDTAQPEVFARADNVGLSPADRGGSPEIPNRIPGLRFAAGPYDHLDAGQFRQPPRQGRFGTKVAAIGDLNNDGVSELVISSPRNERHLQDLQETFGQSGTHLRSTRFRGSITVIPGDNYNDVRQWGDVTDPVLSTTAMPRLAHNAGGRCLGTPQARSLQIAPDTFEVFAEGLDDELGDGQSAGDFNLDGLADLLCGAPLNNRDGEDDAESLTRDTGATYILYGRSVLNDFDLKNADDPVIRTPMLRVRGVLPGDRIGWRQSRGLDVNGDRIDDVFISSPYTDFGGILREECGADFNGDGVFDDADLDRSRFTSCRFNTGSYVFSDDACKAFDYDFDNDIDDDDRAVFDRLLAGDDDACDNLVDNGFVGIIYGGVFTDGDRSITQIATSDLVGVRFFGSQPGHRAGFDVSSAGDFNQDGFGDILIAVPGETRRDAAGRERLGVVYLVFGGTHLRNTTWNLNQVGSPELPGMVILSPYLKGRPNEAPPERVGFLGDINADGFGDIGIGLPRADFIDLSFPQGADAPDDPAVGRRRDAGDAYIIYGNNFGSNRGLP